MTVEIVYETHAITEDNENGIATGRLPGRLSERGRLVARELGERRRDDGLAAVFTSDLDRAVETARIAFADVEIPTFQDRRLRECDYGELNGRPLTDFPMPRSQFIDRPFPGGQSYQEVVDVTRGFLADLAEAWNGKRILIIAHSANRYALQALLGGTSIEDEIDGPFLWQPGWEFTLSGSSRGSVRNVREQPGFDGFADAEAVGGVDQADEAGEVASGFGGLSCDRGRVRRNGFDGVEVH
jgi:broad specificity phosphatase PhoE